MKWQGILCFGVFLSLFARFLCQEEKKKAEETAGLLWLWQNIKREIVCFARPLPDIFKDMPQDTRLPRAFYRILTEKGLHEALLCKELHLNDKERNMLLGFSDRLGSALAEEEEKDCLSCIAYLTDAEKEKRAKEGDRIRLCRALVLCLGGMVLLLFL